LDRERNGIDVKANYSSKSKAKTKEKETRENAEEFGIGSEEHEWW